MEHNRTRGQVFALEGIISALIVIGALVLGLQAVDTAPWNDDERDRGENLRTDVDDVLAVAEDRGALTEAVTTVDSNGQPRPIVPSADTQITLDRIFEDTAAVRTEFRVEYDYHDENGEVQTVVVRDEEPSTTLPTATATRQVVLFDDDTVRTGPGGNQVEGTLRQENDDIYLEDQEPGDSLYAVVTVRVIAW